MCSFNLIPKIYIRRFQKYYNLISLSEILLKIYIFETHQVKSAKNIQFISLSIIILFICATVILKLQEPASTNSRKNTFMQPQKYFAEYKSTSFSQLDWPYRLLFYVGPL